MLVIGYSDQLTLQKPKENVPERLISDGDRFYYGQKQSAEVEIVRANSVQELKHLGNIGLASFHFYINGKKPEAEDTDSTYSNSLSNKKFTELAILIGIRDLCKELKNKSIHDSIKIKKMFISSKFKNFLWFLKKRLGESGINFDQPTEEIIYFDIADAVKLQLIINSRITQIAEGFINQGFEDNIDEAKSTVLSLIQDLV